MFYSNFVRLCKKNGKTPSAVAEELGFSRAASSGWADGSKPRKSTLIIIADYFGITVEELMAGVDGAKKAPTEISEREGISPAKQALLDAIDGLSDEQCEKLLIVVEGAKKLL